MHAKLKETVKRIVDLLVTGDFDQVAKITNGQRLNTRSISDAITTYGRNLVAPPDNAYNQIDVVAVTSSNLPCWSLRMNLWTAEEGRSDLTVELTITEVEGQYTLELDDIHVL